MLSAAFSLGIFGILTLVYFVARYYFVDKKVGGKGEGMMSKILGLIYMALTIAAQVGVNASNAAEVCNGAPQIVSALMYTALPNFFILGLVIVILSVLPGWKSPFSNTIGYVLVYLMGVNSAFTDLLKSKGSRLVHKILENKSIMINEITPFNFSAFLKRMNSDGLLVSGYESTKAFTNLWEFVVIKDSIAEFVWIILTGALVVSTTYNAILEITCNIPTGKRKEMAAAWKADESKAAANEPKSKYFTLDN